MPKVIGWSAKLALYQLGLVSAIAFISACCQQDVPPGTVRQLNRCDADGRVVETGLEVRADTNTELWAPIGVHRTFYASGQPKSEGEWRNRGDARVSFLSDKWGPWTYWYPSGMIESRGTYAVEPAAGGGYESVRSGTWEFFDETGVRDERRSGVYTHGTRTD